MKIKTGFVLHSVGNEHVVVAVEERTHSFHGMIRLNSTGAFLWQKMQEETTENDLVRAIISEYNINDDIALEAVKSFVKQLSDADVIDK